jgi:hypothetical protein
MIDESNAQLSILPSLELAKHVLVRLVYDHESVESKAEDFDNRI